MSATEHPGGSVAAALHVSLLCFVLFIHLILFFCYRGVLRHTCPFVPLLFPSGIQVIGVKNELSVPPCCETDAPALTGRLQTSPGV